MRKPRTSGFPPHEGQPMTLCSGDFRCATRTRRAVMSTQVYDYLLAAAAEVPNAAALEFMGQPVTYGRLAENARKLASGLTAHGVPEGASVGLMLPNIPQFV